MTSIYRIVPPVERSPLATASLAGLAVIEMPWVAPLGTGREACVRAAALAHAACLRAFLAGPALRCATLEDDAIVLDRAWLDLTEFDCFAPCADHGAERPLDMRIVRDHIPPAGSQAQLVSRRFAGRWLWLLERSSGPGATRRAAARALRVGCYRGNAVAHDLTATSLIDDPRIRRLAHWRRQLAKPPLVVP